MRDTAFSYKQGNSLMHCCPAWIKILLIPVLSIMVFKLPPVFALVFFVIQAIIAFALRFTVCEQLRDLRAVLYYALLLLFAKMIGNVAVMVTNGTAFGFSELPELAIDFLTGEKETFILLLKLLCIMQSASIIFKTSTSLQIREGLEQMETAVCRFFHLKKRTEIAQTVSLFICFIPQVSKNWQQAERAWKARGGKKSLKMLVVLLPVFLSVGMKQAYNSARALAVRQ